MARPSAGRARGTIETRPTAQTWTLESFPFKLQTGVKERQIRTFAQLEFIPKAENIVFIGETELAT